MPVHSRSSILHSPFSVVLFLLMLGLPAPSFPQSKLLDDFADITGWKPVVSEGARLTLTQGEGKNAASRLREEGGPDFGAEVLGGG